MKQNYCKPNNTIHQLVKLLSYNTFILILCLILPTIIAKKSFADCSFYIINNSDYDLKFIAGFKKSVSENILVHSSSSNTITIEHNKYNCTSTINNSYGRAYIKLDETLSNNKYKQDYYWVYLPKDNIIKAVGIDIQNKNNVLAFNKNYNKLILFDNQNINQNQFRVRVNNAQRHKKIENSMK